MIDQTVEGERWVPISTCYALDVADSDYVHAGAYIHKHTQNT